MADTKGKNSKVFGLKKKETLGQNEKAQIHRSFKNNNNTLHVVYHLQTIIIPNKISIKKLKVEDSIQK